MKMTVDTDSIGSDISELTQLLGQARKQLQKMTESINELSTTWEGSAHDEFLKQYNIDSEGAKKYFSEVDDVLKRMSDAKRAYDLCDVAQAVKVVSININ